MPTGQTTTANITAKALSVSGITASNKIYDSNAVATLDTTSLVYNGIVAGDDFTGTYTGAYLITRMLEQVRRLRLHQHILVLM